jgi:hypothetical protein
MQGHLTKNTNAALNPRLLQLAAGYYLLCGATAIAWPQCWYWATDLYIPGVEPLLAAVGALMLALTYAAWQTQRQPACEALVLRTLLVANAADLITVAVALIRGQLPVPNALIFIAVAVTWCYFINRAISRTTGAIIDA